MIGSESSSAVSQGRLARPRSITRVHSKSAAVALATLGTFALVVAVAAVASSQVGIPDCSGCVSSDDCGAQICSGTPGLLALSAIMLAIGPTLVGLGLAVWPSTPPASASGSIPGEPGAEERKDRVAIAAGVSLYGVSWLLAGILLPYDGICVSMGPGPCSYPYVLNGIPLALTIGGVVIAAIGFLLLLDEHRGRVEVGLRTPPT